MQANLVTALWKTIPFEVPEPTGQTNAARRKMRPAAERSVPQDAPRRRTLSERFRAFKIYRFLLMDRDIAEALRAITAKASFGRATPTPACECGEASEVPLRKARQREKLQAREKP